MHVVQIFGQGPVSTRMTQPALPGVKVRIDQAGDDDAPGQIDDVSVGPMKPPAHVSDAITVDEYVDAFCVGPHG